MLLPLVAHFAASHFQDSVQIKTGLLVTGITAPGRVPVPQDPVLAKFIRGEAVHPIAGDIETSPTGATSIWKGVVANASGEFDIQGSGYLYATIESDSEKSVLLVASGDSFVYVNGQIRPGDYYQTEYLKLPITLHKGTNEFLFGVGRGALKARLETPTSPIQLLTGDLTMPDEIPGDAGSLFGGIVIANSSATDVTNLTIACAGDGKDVVSILPRIPAMSIRKVRFEFPSSAQDLDLILLQDGKPIHSANVKVESRNVGETYRRTFESSIDGSVQYYAVNPSSKPDKSNALILSLHGASVEALGQARAYKSKDWATLVAPTNRRPYGFDWEDWGRMDALEVLSIAGASIPHDSKRVVVTGHSMGGHGTWSIGTLFPDRFGATAPSASWISFWTYGGGWEPSDPTTPEQILRRSMLPFDTMARISNLTAEKVYILHGDADETVPVEQARAMSKALAAAGISFGYHEEPGAGHWWGSLCVDYPDLMTTLSGATISDFKTVDFTTPDPAISGTCGWLTIEQQIHPRILSRVKGDSEGLMTENVRTLRITKPLVSLVIDGQTFKNLAIDSILVHAKDSWRVGRLSPSDRVANFSGPMKQAFNERFVLVYGTKGTAEVNRWSRDKARFDAESFYYRGNGSVEVVSDRVFLSGDTPKGEFRNRNVVVYGNSDSNLAWGKLLRHCPIRMELGEVVTREKTLSGLDLGGMFIYPSGSRLVAAIGGTGIEGMRLTERIPVLGAGTAYPDWLILDSRAIDQGTKGIVGAGFYASDWGFAAGDHAWLP